MLVLILIPAMMTAVGVAREKETGSIANFRSTPITGIEFLLGKQLPYVAIGLVSFLTLLLMAIYLFGVPVKGSLATLLTGVFIYIGAATAFGLLDLLLHLHSDRRDFHDNDPDHGDRDQFLGTAGPLFVAFGRRPLDRSRLPVGMVHANQPRNLHQGPRLRRPLVRPPGACSSSRWGSLPRQRVILRKQEA